MVNLASMVSVHSEETVSLVIGNSGSIGAVNGDLMVVSTKSVSMGVRI